MDRLGHRERMMAMFQFSAFIQLVHRLDFLLKYSRSQKDTYRFTEADRPYLDVLEEIYDQIRKPENRELRNDLDSRSGSAMVNQCLNEARLILGGSKNYDIYSLEKCLRLAVSFCRYWSEKLGFDDFIHYTDRVCEMSEEVQKRKAENSA